MKQSEGTFLTMDNNKLFTRSWASEDPVGNFVIIHGFGTHSGRYQQLASDLNSNNISCYSFDLRGHGKSPGQRGYIKDFNQYYDDINTFINQIPKSKKDIPMFLFGHSLGGLLAFRFMQISPSAPVNGVILSSPLFGIGVEIPPIKRMAAPLLKTFLPKLTLNNEIDPNFISHDPLIVKRYIEDPMVHDRVSGTYFYYLLDEMGKGLQKAPLWKCPILIQYAGDDKIASPSATEKVCSVISPKFITQKKYDGFYHEIFNEVERDRPVKDLIQWIKQKLN